MKYQGYLPTRAKLGDAGYDLQALFSCEIEPGKTKLIKTGFRMQMDMDMVGLVCSRSGIALKHSVFVLNAPGIIDSGYTGDVGVILHNAGERTFEVKAGDKVAQLVFMKVEHPDFEEGEFSETDRGQGGFGHTG